MLSLIYEAGAQLLPRLLLTNPEESSTATDISELALAMIRFK